MLKTPLPFLSSVQPSDFPTINRSVSHTFCPLMLDELQREVTSAPIVRIMEAMSFHSESEAERHLNSLMMRARNGESLAKSDAERREDDARKLVAEAFLCTNKAERLAKASEALALFPGFAEAYIILSEEEEDLAKRLDLLETAVGIASAQFDSELFAAPEKVFWQRMATRPYMRCRAALALELWQQGKKQAAIEHCKALLKLNPRDNQGLRFHLLNWLLACDLADPCVDEYFSLYEEEGTAFGLYANVLWNFVRHGDQKRSQKALEKALEGNKFVPTLLLGAAPTPQFTSRRVERGSVPEAVAYCRIGGAAWQNIDGALPWLKQKCASMLTSKTLLRKIETAEDWHQIGTWAGQVPMYLNIGRQKVWF